MSNLELIINSLIHDGMLYMILLFLIPYVFIKADRKIVYIDLYYFLVYLGFVYYANYLVENNDLIYNKYLVSLQLKASYLIGIMLAYNITVILSGFIDRKSIIEKTNNYNNTPTIIINIRTIMSVVIYCCVSFAMVYIYKIEKYTFNIILNMLICIFVYFAFEFIYNNIIINMPKEKGRINDILKAFTNKE